MCGIVGYIGKRQAAPVLLEGLSRLEYRGYDSAGIAVRNGSGKTEIVRAKGRLKALAERTDGGRFPEGCCGIGHTRWATHGEPSEVNAHPHCSDDKNVVLVHNGVVENYRELKEKLLKAGYSFYSQTDTEVLAKLTDHYYKKYGGGPTAALSRCLARVRGSCALAAMFKEFPDELYAARRDSPLIVGEADGEVFLASDVPAILKYTRSVYYVGDSELVRLSRGKISFFNPDLEELSKEKTEIGWDAESAEKAGFEHFMLKEIHEQPRAVRDTVNAALSDGGLDLSDSGLTEERMKRIGELCIVACGSAYHAGVAAQYAIESLARLPVRVELASEFRYRNPVLSKDCLVVVISQSGETADSLAALREAKRRGAETLAVVNVVGSSVAREADFVFYTPAGPEIAVATTKAYSAQLVACYLFAVQLARVRGGIDGGECARLVGELSALPGKLERILKEKERIQRLSTKLAGSKDIFFIGRGPDYAVSLEGSLKMKEISYIHSEAYAAGELKHGPISLIEDGTPVVSVLTQETLCEKTLGSMAEAKSRGACLIAITCFEGLGVEDAADFTILIPRTDPRFSPVLAVLPLQLMGYYVSVAKGLDVDKPRNLAKSVTVE